MKLSLTTSGFSKASKQLEGAAALAKNPSPPAKAAAEWITGQTMQVFAIGGHGGEWAPLGKMTMFLRKHRANTPRKSDAPGNDTGRLKGSFLPFVDEGGTAFGAGTNVDYAEAFAMGGPSRPNDVAIAPFSRKRPASLGMVGGQGKYKSRNSGKVKVSSFVMHMKGGGMYDPRPFFPEGVSGLAAWGYLDKVRQIFKIEFHNRLGGTE